MKDFRKDRGFTLVEILMAVFIGLILLGAVYVSMNSGQRTSAGVERKVAAQQDVRAALELMAMEISMASFNPNLTPGAIWKNPPVGALAPFNGTPACTDASGHPEYKGIQEATPTSLTVEMDINQNGIIGDIKNEIIRYAWDATQFYISRNVGYVAGDPDYNCTKDLSFLGDVTGAVEGTRNVRVKNNTMGINNNNGIPAIFRYYDGKNPATELHPDTTQTDIAKIRRIDIALGVETEEVDPNTHQNKRMIYSTSVLVRNHVLN
jgi:prepilin-type N-terminal cleavage/methylation domain-containing protein